MASSVSVVVRVRDATREGLRDVRNSINGLNRGILQAMSDTFSDGIGQSIATGLKAAMSNPYVMAAIVAFTAILVTQIGAALAGALVLAFGGAFVALGVMAAQGSKKVQETFTKELKSLKKAFKDASEPLIPVLVHAAHLMGDLGRKFAPAFKKAMAEAAPALDNFLEQMSKGIEKFGKVAFDPMMKAFDKLIVAIDWEGFLGKLGDSFKNLADSVSNNTSEVAAVFDRILGVLPALINMIASLTNAWAEVKPWFDVITGIIKIALTPALIILGAAFQIVKDIQSAMIGPLNLLKRAMQAFYEEGLVPVGRFIKETLGPVWRGLVDGFKEGWKNLEVGLVPVLKDFWEALKNAGREALSMIPGLEGLRDKSQSAGKVIKEWIIDKMTALSDWLVEHREDINNWGKKIAEGIIGVGIVVGFLIGLLIQAFTWVHANWDLIMTVSGINLVTTLIGWLITAFNWVHSNWDLILKIYGIEFIITAIGWAKDLWGWITRNWSAAIYFSLPGIGGIMAAVDTLWSWVNRNWSRIINFHFTVSGAWDAIKSAAGFAHGGVIGAAATGGVRNGLTMVGENGPELVNLAPGSHVKSNPDTRRLMAQSGAPGGGSNLIIKSSGRRVDDMLIEVLREAIHQRGGDPVTVLGGSR